jgi:xanthine dehydrogenase accessory factor
MLTSETILGMLENGPVVLVTVERAEGSTPREKGARMAVRADGAFSGTIGGGALEWRALAEAQRMLGGGPARATLDMALGPELGQCCGGRVRLRFERFSGEERARLSDLATAEREASRAAPVVLFGAGHVGRALVLALAPLPFAVEWIDTRAEAFPAHVPANARCCVLADPAAAAADAPPGAQVLVMTHSHALDLAVVAAALRRGDLAIGLIGSATKRARFAKRLAEAGLDAAPLVCPIGVPELGKEPAAIAAGIAVELLRWRAAVLRSRPPQSGDPGPVGGVSDESAPALRFASARDER